MVLTFSELKVNAYNTYYNMNVYNNLYEINTFACIIYTVQ